MDRTAHALEVHPNTVRNRLRRYEALTDVTLRATDDLLAVRLALLRAALDERA
ncbi:helix-turn-helix domain-containing protein [Svornostia abyssi]|uniref:Helix-turn-helix domain-containing protein n=1 Tax=Svornostia abyssi TaxID=2898438 RepID=A0ABY5PCD2_9ACTN|nr:helix-turn-helix domain-containing protein [Parviterribacteraceae bacterium J379]